MPRLDSITEKFVLHWGEMGSCWGVNRSVAQVHALLYSSPKPLNAEEISETLSMARSNVSTSLKELQTWGVIRVAGVIGDRRDHFESLTDVWEMFTIILAERRKREVEPTIRVLRECADELHRKGEDRTIFGARVAAMLDFMETTDAWYLQMRRLPKAAVVRFFKMGAKLRKLVGAGS